MHGLNTEPNTAIIGMQIVYCMYSNDNAYTCNHASSWLVAWLFILQVA